MPSLRRTGKKSAACSVFGVELDFGLLAFIEAIRLFDIEEEYMEKKKGQYVISHFKV